METRIPYGKNHLNFNIPDGALKGVLMPDYAATQADEKALIAHAMAHPIGSPPLEQLAKGKTNILIVASDHTRPMPSRLIFPPLLSAIKAANPDALIKVLIATGFHRASTKEELYEKFGSLMDGLDIEIHDSRDSGAMVYKGMLPSGGELWLNSLVDWADLIVSEGFIEPHFFAGFSGGRKSILPGIASQRTVFANHCSKFIAHPAAKAGILQGNPIHVDMAFAAEKAGLAFILNVALDAQKRVAAAFAGDPFLAHEKGCGFVLEHCSAARVQADIVIASNGGYPLDQNIYQAVKGMTAAEACVRKGGVIIVCASCCDGHGGEDFYRWFTQNEDARAVAQKIACIPQDRTRPDQWEAQILARVLRHAQVIMVCNECARELACSMGMRCAATPDEALALAYTLAKGQEIAVIPDGVGVIITD